MMVLEGVLTGAGFWVRPVGVRSTFTMSVSLSDGQTRQFIQDGYVAVRGLLPPEIVAATREALLAAMGIDAHAPTTWEGKALSADPAVIALTAPCRTAGV